MPIFPRPTPHILSSAQLLIRGTCKVLEKPIFSGSEVDRGILSGAFRLIECYKYDAFDFSDPHYRGDILEKFLQTSETAKLRTALFGAGAKLFPADTPEVIADRIQRELSEYADQLLPCRSDTKKFFELLRLKLNAL